MGLLDDVKGFTSGVAEKTKGNVDVISLNQQISSAEKDLKEMYIRLGAKYYEQHSNDPDAQLTEEVNAVRGSIERLLALRNQVEQKKEQIASVQLVNSARPQVQPNVVMSTGGKVCIKCGSPIGDDPFCMVCGAKQEQEVPEQIEEASEQQQSERKFCADCGTELDADAIFCPVCGKKYEAE